MSRKNGSFRVGRVTVYARGRVWYLCYWQEGRRYRPRVGSDRSAARKLAAQINAQLENEAPVVLGFEPIAIEDLRGRWLEHHENVLRSSIATIRRYRAASEHLVNFVQNGAGIKLTSHFGPRHAEDFIVHLRHVRVAPNGHPHSAKRGLRDKGVKFIAEVCRALFNYAAKRRHLPPYTEDPFGAVQIDRIPIEDAKPFVALTEQQEQEFFHLCDEWQLPVFAVLLLTGLRPGELTHLLLPDDLDLHEGWLHVRNKPDLGWRVKTRNERSVPLAAELAALLRPTVGERRTGPVFLQRRFLREGGPPLGGQPAKSLCMEIARRVDRFELDYGRKPDREELLGVHRTLWRDMGAIKADHVRVNFIRLTRQVGAGEITAPKSLRHMFATCLQDANVDPLIRNQVMGHVPAGAGSFNTALGMTGVYTHTRPETLRRQVLGALQARPALDALRCRIADRG